MSGFPRFGVRGIVLGTGVAIVAAAVGSPAALGAHRTAAMNRAAAVRSADALFRQLVLPPGSVALSGEPGDDRGALAEPAALYASPKLVDRHGWWRVSAPMDAVLAFVRAHPPSGVKRTDSGSERGAGGSQIKFVEFKLPGLRGVLVAPTLVVSTTVSADGTTGVRADAEVVWIIPRLASEKVPAGVREVDITLSAWGDAAARSLHVTNRAKVHRIVEMIDRLPAIQPGPTACPGFSGQIVTFAFRASPEGPALATASELAGITERETECAPMSFTIHGKPQTPLLRGAVFLHRVKRLLGATLTGTS